LAWAAAFEASARVKSSGRIEVSSRRMAASHSPFSLASHSPYPLGHLPSVIKRPPALVDTDQMLRLAGVKRRVEIVRRASSRCRSAKAHRFLGASSRNTDRRRFFGPRASHRRRGYRS
jgi:hypothetical protein